MAFASRDDLRAWLSRNHDASKGLWVRLFKKGSDTPSISFEDLLDEGLCFGWSESQRKKGDASSYLQRFTPRRTHGTTSERNKEHIRRLIREHRMTPAGLKVLKSTDGLNHEPVNRREDAPMTTREQIKAYLATHPEPKRSDMQALHRTILKLMPKCTLWFMDGRDEKGKIVSNPTIGYGTRTITYADGKTKKHFQIGLSANSSGISVYILGIEDKSYLPRTLGKTLGKASITGYCIKFRKLTDIRIEVLEDAIRDGVERTKDGRN